MRSLIVRLLRYLLYFAEPTSPAHTRAKELTQWVEGLEIRGKKVSGERKRRQVYLRLASEFPELQKREISLLIEKVLLEQ
jgi:hypothetical protein